MQGSDVIVVGAGVAGLWCAALLASAGMRVTVMEADRAVGGRARSWRDEATGVEVDIGPHVVSTEHRNFLAMLEHLGTRQQITWQPDPLITLLDAGEKLRMPNRAWVPPLHGLPLVPAALRRLSWADLLSHWRLAWTGARENERTLRGLDGVDAATWLKQKGVSSRSIDWFWRSAMLALLNAPLEDCSAAAVLRIFRLMMGRSGYHFGFPQVGLSELYAGGCMAAVERAGGGVWTQAVVHDLFQQAGRWTVRTRDGRVADAPRVVLALPPAQLAQLLRSSVLTPLQHVAESADRFAPSPYISTFVWFDRGLSRDMFWARVWNPQDLNTDFYDLANIRPSLAAQGSLVACNAIGPNVRGDATDEEIVAQTLREIADYAPAARQARVLHTRVHRIPMAIPVPAPGTESLRPPARTPVAGLWLAGDWTDTELPCSMESAARSGAIAAEAVLGHAGHPRRLALDAPETVAPIAWLRKRTPS